MAVGLVIFRVLFRLREKLNYSAIVVFELDNFQLFHVFIFIFTSSFSPFALNSSPQIFNCRGFDVRRVYSCSWWIVAVVMRLTFRVGFIL